MGRLPGFTHHHYDAVCHWNPVNVNLIFLCLFVCFVFSCRVSSTTPNFPASSTLDAKPFVINDFVIGSVTANIAHFTPDGSELQVTRTCAASTIVRRTSFLSPNDNLAWTPSRSPWEWAEKRLGVQATLHLLFSKMVKKVWHKLLLKTLLFGFLGMYAVFLESLEKLDPFHGMEVLFPKYFQSISWIFPFHGKHSHNMELEKIMEIGYSNLFLQYFQNISIPWKRSNVAFWPLVALVS